MRLRKSGRAPGDSDRLTWSRGSSEFGSIDFDMVYFVPRSQRAHVTFLLRTSQKGGTLSDISEILDRSC